MAKQPPKWQQVGLTKDGPGKYHYIDESGKRVNVSERQMRKLVGTPAKGSQGAYEYRKAKYGEEFAGKPPKDSRPYSARLREFLEKTPGGTEEWFKTGKRPELTWEQDRYTLSHNKAIDAQRKESLSALKKAGMITETEYRQRKAQIDLAASYRDKVFAIEERVRNRRRAVAEGRAKPMTMKEIQKLKQEQEVYKREYNKYETKLYDFGIIPEINEFKHGWYSSESASRVGARKKAS